MGKEHTSPFKFLDSYEKEDASIFFGRKTETDTLYQLVKQNSLVLLYGSSGTGKTSLIQCGLGNRFHKSYWYPIFIRRGNQGMHDSLRNSIEKELGKRFEGELTDAIEKLYIKRLRPIYLIFDQFEEIFVLGDEQEQTQFIEEISKILSADLPCQIIFSLREEYLGHLYAFEQVIPTLFDCRLRVEPMNVTNVKEVIQKSCEQFNISLKNPKKNTQQIIGKVSDSKSGVSLPYLQVYLDRLYQEDIVRTYGKNVPNIPLPELEFTVEEIDSLGDIGDVLKIFLQEQRERIQSELQEKYPGSPEQSVRKLLNSFASLEGTKIPQDKANIKLPGLSETGRDFILDELQQSRILREEGGTYELAHDTLSLRISEQRSGADIALLEAADLVQGRMRAFERTAAYLNVKELQLIENYAVQLKEEEKLKPEAWDFVKESQEHVRREENRRKLITGGVMAVLVAFLAFAGWQWSEARDSLSLVVGRDMERKDQALKAMDDSLAYNIVLEAIELNSSNRVLDTGILELAYYYNEMGRSGRADSLLLELDGYKRADLSSNVETVDLKEEIQRLAGDTLFNSLEARYYPSLIKVEGGTFWMGDSADRRATAHQVRLDDFEMGQFEVTVFQYELYLKSQSQSPDSLRKSPPSWGWKGDNPIIYVDWYDAVEYCNWLSVKKGYTPVYNINKLEKDTITNLSRYDSKRYTVEIDSIANGYRLPTEAEWEYAAGGGMPGRNSTGNRNHVYAGSDSLELVGWYYKNSHTTNPVGGKLPNELGLYDMSGNVFEWCQDWYGPYPTEEIESNPRGPKSGANRVIRGGSWSFDAEYLQVSYRYSSVPYARNSNGGFRIARTLTF